MGTYDSIMFKCTCGREIEAQSKSSDCSMRVFDYTDVPESVAQDANRHAPFTCDCGKRWQFEEREKRVALKLIEL